VKVHGGLDYYLVYLYIYLGSIISAAGGCLGQSLCLGGGAMISDNYNSGTSMLRRLFPLPVTIAFYWPEPVTRWRGGTSSPNAGKEVCRKIAKTSAFGFSLACLIGKSYDFAVYRIVQAFFPGGIRLEMGFRPSKEPG
jgi:hypothetical protein